jgi:hypothetical protein
MKTGKNRVLWASAWAWLCITVWAGTPVALAWLLMPRQTEVNFWITLILGVNLLSFYFFSWMAADPRGGWGLWWYRERRDGASNFATAGLVFVLALLWAVMGVSIAKLSWTKREELTDQLNREDDRWLKMHPNHA